MEFGLSRTIQLASELVADLVSDLLQTGSISSNLVADRFADGLRSARELVYDLLVLASC